MRKKWEVHRKNLLKIKGNWRIQFGQLASQPTDRAELITLAYFKKCLLAHDTYLPLHTYTHIYNSPIDNNCKNLSEITIPLCFSLRLDVV